MSACVRPFLAMLAVLSGLCAAAAGERGRPSPPAAVDGLRDCPGGFVLPGRSGCVRLSGQVAVAATLRAGSLPQPSVLARSGARLAADVRIPTGYGPLRAYAAIRIGDPRGGR